MIVVIPRTDLTDRLDQRVDIVVPNSLCVRVHLSLFFFFLFYRNRWILDVPGNPARLVRLDVRQRDARVSLIAVEQPRPVRFPFLVD